MLDKITKLHGIIPSNVIIQLPEVINKYKINNPLRLSHFISQCQHESGNFRLTVENLNYSADALTKVFKKYFPTIEVANLYARKPEMIGNRVYANRLGNGDEQSGDGFKYRGRGYIQLTGKSNYVSFNNDNFGINKLDNDTIIDCVKNPDLVSFSYAMLSAAWFWDKTNLNIISDKGARESDIIAVTKKINGGTNGLADRVKYFNKIYPILK